MKSPLAESNRVLVDAMCGTLAVYLRMCGWDAAYAGDLGLQRDTVIRELARKDDRVVVSRDRPLIERCDRGVLLRSREVEGQLRELRQHGAALTIADPPTRCGRCNGRLVDEPPDLARPAYAPTDETIRCWRCRRCGQYFWKGSHWDRVRSVLCSVGAC